MKAITYTRYGSPDVLQFKDVDKPLPKDDEVLIKVHAASINSWDWDLISGTPFLFRFWGLLKPKYHIPGADIAGKVEAIGVNVTKFKPGDEVFGDLCESGWGGFAEYVSAPENALSLKPASMTFLEAASMPQAAVIALLGVRDYGQVQPGQKVLINGAGGGMGTFAVQLAKSMGAEVTGVDSTPKLEIMRSIGADKVIDYSQEDFTKNGECYDFIFDTSAYHSIFDYNRALNPGGLYLIVGGSIPRILQALIVGSLFSMMGSKKFRILPHQANKNLDAMKDLFESGKISPVIDRTFALHEIPEAFRHFDRGNFKGKIVITIETTDYT